MQAVKQQYSDKNANIIYSDFEFKDGADSDDSDAEPAIRLIRPTDLDTCQIALEPKKGQVSHSHTCLVVLLDGDLCRFKHQPLTFGPRAMILKD